MVRRPATLLAGRKDVAKRMYVMSRIVLFLCTDGST
jgi:hypothetical protein